MRYLSNFKHIGKHFDFIKVNTLLNVFNDFDFEVSLSAEDFFFKNAQDSY